MTAGYIAHTAAEDKVDAAIASHNPPHSAAEARPCCGTISARFGFWSHPSRGSFVTIEVANTAKLLEAGLVGWGCG
jgi:hypothetical protein